MTATIAASFSGLLWTIAYVLIIRRGRRDRVYGMPIVALCANIVWEFYYSVVDLPPFTDPMKQHAQFIIGLVWFIFDTVILWQALRYGPRQFTWLGRRGYYAMFALSLAIVGPMVVLLDKEFHDSYAVHSAILQNLMMSWMFLAMLSSRRSLAGQSLGIALAKMGGTICATLGLLLDPPIPVYRHSVLLPFVYVATFVLDLAYTGAVWRLGRAPVDERPVPDENVAVPV
jgi:hypothetical protein